MADSSNEIVPENEDSPYVRRVKRVVAGIGIVVTLSAASIASFYHHKLVKSVPERTPQVVSYENLRDRVIPALEREKKDINSGIVRMMPDISVDDFTALYSAEIERISRLDSTINEKRAEMFADANTPEYRKYFAQHEVVGDYGDKFTGGFVSTLLALGLSLFGYRFAGKMARRGERYRSQTAPADS